MAHPICEACERESEDLIGGLCPACRADYEAYDAEQREKDIEAMEADEDFGPDDYDDSMDGDHESALASCGWGTDEDYGCFGDDEGW